MASMSDLIRPEYRLPVQVRKRLLQFKEPRLARGGWRRTSSDLSKDPAFPRFADQRLGWSFQPSPIRSSAAAKPVNPVNRPYAAGIPIGKSNPASSGLTSANNPSTNCGVSGIERGHV